MTNRNPRQLAIRTVVAIAMFFLLAACANEIDSMETDTDVAICPSPDTGQTTSYTETFGEDTDYSIKPPSYTDNGDGTVSDNVTGLMWQQYDGGEVAYDDAVVYCTALSLGGHTDWRLPTSRELFSINCFGALGPALDTSVFPQTYGSEDYVKELYWWSSDERADTDTRAWVTNAGGGIGAHRKAETYSVTPSPTDGHVRYFHVRAVRSTATVELPSVHYSDNGDGTVTDRYTGLVWQQTVSADTYTWEEALASVNTLNATGGYAGYTDWRLPNIRELLSLVDVAIMQPCIHGVVFGLSALAPYTEPTTPDEPGIFWSSTSMHNSDPEKSTQAWDLHDVYSGIISYSPKTATEHILCVRGGL